MYNTLALDSIHELQRHIAEDFLLRMSLMSLLIWLMLIMYYLYELLVC